MRVRPASSTMRENIYLSCPNTFRLNRVLLIIFFALLLPALAGGQSIYDIDMKLSALLQKVNYWDEFDYHDPTSTTKDSLDKANEDLYQYLLRTCSKVPATLTADLPKAMRNRMTIVSSLDEKVKLYSWDSRMGGSNHYYENIAQYQTPEGVRAVDMRDSITQDRGSNFEGIATVYSWSGKTVYLVRDYRILSARSRQERLRAFILADGRLKQLPLFKIRNERTHEISITYDQIKTGRRFPLKYMPEIHLSLDRQRLYVPTVADDDEMTGRYYVYEFDGEQFIYHRNDK